MNKNIFLNYVSLICFYGFVKKKYYMLSIIYIIFGQKIGFKNLRNNNYNVYKLKKKKLLKL